MNPRIALSLLLALSLLACASQEGVTADDQPNEEMGIGTSPSDMFPPFLISFFRRVSQQWTVYEAP